MKKLFYIVLNTGLSPTICHSCDCALLFYLPQKYMRFHVCFKQRLNFIQLWYYRLYYLLSVFNFTLFEARKYLQALIEQKSFVFGQWLLKNRSFRYLLLIVAIRLNDFILNMHCVMIQVTWFLIYQRNIRDVWLFTHLVVGYVLLSKRFCVLSSWLYRLFLHAVLLLKHLRVNIAHYPLPHSGFDSGCKECITSAVRQLATQ